MDINFNERLKTAYYTDINKFLEAVGDLPEYKAPNKNIYLNVPCSFDIETTSFFVHKENGDIITTKDWAKLTKGKNKFEKQAIMYIWQFGIDGLVVIGRTWLEFITLLMKISEKYGLHENKRLVCFVHNLSFEFQWIKKWMKWFKVFATKPYEPLTAVCEFGVEFRCSYRLTGKSLALLGDSLLTYTDVKKMVGDLDYDLLRHPETPLTAAEMGYCINDVRVVMAYIKEQIEIEGKVHRIPLTKTGYVRRFLKNACFKDPKNKKRSKVKRFRYRNFIKNLTLTREVFDMAQDALQGGFVHANPLYVDEIQHDITSLDISSSYPCIMVAEKFPMSTPKRRKIKSRDELDYYLNGFCCLFTVEFENIEDTFEHDHYLARARCSVCENSTIDNGRVVRASRIVTTITEQDFFIIEKMYTWDRMKIHRFYTSVRDYLPKDIVESVLTLYKDKTELKGIEGKELEYMLSKELLNSCFGCMIQGIYNPEIILNDRSLWEISPDSKSVNEVLEEYNAKPSRFLYFLWGLWVTAYGRRNIMTSVFECKEDHRYSDTDSDKIANHDKHKAFYDRYNDRMTSRLLKALAYHDLNPDLITPRNKKGEVKPMGIFELEETYTTFKTLGAKRYMAEHDGELAITIAGLPKKNGSKYIQKEYNDPFKAFTDGLHVPALETGKLTHTYIEEEQEGTLTDYTGQTYNYFEYSSVHLAPCDFSIGLPDEYVKFVQSLKYACYDFSFM